MQTDVGLPAKLRLSDDVLLVDGMLGNDVDYFLETVTEAGLREATPHEVDARAANIDAAVILCGHTHLARFMTLADGQMIVDPGSVGLPAYDDDRPWPYIIESRTSHARHVIVSDDARYLSPELLAINCEWRQAARDKLVNRRKDWARFLRTGRPIENV